MILEQIFVKNWRGYREPHTFRFQDGINLLVGRNEAGKSTLFEVLTRVLFDRHKSKTEEILAMRPVGSGLGPEAEVQFRVDGRRYRAEKRFLQDPKSALYAERNGRWELDHEGDAADARLREILRGEATLRTAARPEHRGLAQALWFLQSDGAIPETAWSEGVKQGLQGLVRLAARSPLETAVVERVRAFYEQDWTPTGRVRANSELDRLQKELPTLEERCARLEKHFESIQSHRAELEEIRASEADKRLELEKAQADLAEWSARVQRAEELEKERERKERAKNAALEKAQRLREDLAKIADKQKKIQACSAEAKALESELAEVAGNAKAEAAVRDRHARRAEEELQPAWKVLDAELQALRALERVRMLEQERNRLEQHVRTVDEVEKRLEALQRERAALVAPDEKEWKRFGRASEKRRVLQAQVEASAIRVRFEWTGSARKVETEPPLVASVGDEYLVAEPTVFQIEGVGKVHVRSGAAALKELLAERGTADREVRQFLTRFGVSDAEGMAALYQRARDLHQEISALQQRLRELDTAQPDAKEQLARITRAIEEETRAASTLPSDVLQQGIAWIREQIAKNERQKQRLDREIREEQKAEQAAATKHLEFVQRQQKISITLAELKAKIHAHEEDIAATLHNYGTWDQLAHLVAAAEEDVQKTSDDLEAFLSTYEENVVVPRRLHEQARNRVRALEEQLTELRTRAREALARIEEAAAQGNDSAWADAKIALDRTKRRVAALERRAKGAKLLYDLVVEHEKQRATALAGPIQELVSRWLRLLTEDKYDALHIDHALKPTGVHMVQYGADLPLASLSHGAQEQVVVLLRLGMAVLVSQQERNLVVIDDRLVNADPVRMKRLCLILREAAEACQIVVATCNDTPYAGLGAHTVRVPIDGSRQT